MNFMIPPGSLVGLFGAFVPSTRATIRNGTQAIIIKWEKMSRVLWAPVVLIDGKNLQLQTLTGSEWEKLIDVLEVPEYKSPVPDEE